MKNKKKKVTKSLAKEIAAKFFGRTVKSVEDVDPEKRRIFYNDGYIFENGEVMLNVFPYFGGEGKDECPVAQVFINHDCAGRLKYIDGVFEYENALHNEYEELQNILYTLKGLIDDAVDEGHIHLNFDTDDRWIIKDKSKLLKALQVLKKAEDLL